MATQNPLPWGMPQQVDPNGSLDDIIAEYEAGTLTFAPITSAAIATTTGTLGESRQISDGADEGARLTRRFGR